MDDRLLLHVPCHPAKQEDHFPFSATAIADIPLYKHVLSRVSTGACLPWLIS